MVGVALFAGALIAAGIVVGILLLLSVNKMIYYPAAGLAAAPADFRLAAEEVTFPSFDGTPLHGWYFPGEVESDVLLVFIHGNAGNISHRLPLVSMFLRVPADFFLFDYRGYGKSGGKPSGEEPLRDARAALEWLKSHPRAAGKRLFLIGESIGASMALILGSEDGIDGVVSLAAFTSIRDMARKMPIFGVLSPLAPRWYDAIGAVPDVRVPTLFVHGTSDEIVPFSHGERLFEAATAPKEHLWVDGGGHNDLFDVAGIEIVGKVRELVGRRGQNHLPGPAGEDVREKSSESSR